MLPARDPGLREATADTVSAVTLADLKQYHAATFRPDLTTIVVIGDVTPEDARTTIARWFGGWQAPGRKPELDLPRVPSNGSAQVTVPDPSAVQASVVLAQQVGVTRFDPDYYALQLGNHVLGGGFYATRLYHDLRQEAGLVYTVDDSLASTRTRSLYTISYGCDPENVSKARDIIQRDLRSMQTDSVTPQELHQAKSLLLRQMLLRESSEDAVGSAVPRHIPPIRIRPRRLELAAVGGEGVHVVHVLGEVVKRVPPRRRAAHAQLDRAAPDLAERGFHLHPAMLRFGKREPVANRRRRLKRHRRGEQEHAQEESTHHGRC